MSDSVSAASGAPDGDNEGVPNYGVAEDFPLLWEKAQAFDFAERLGGCTDPLMAEIDAALQEVWNARNYLASEARRVHGR